MATTYSVRSTVSTTYSDRPTVTTTYSGRLQGAYLVDVAGRYIFTVNGDRIIVLSRNGTIPLNTTQYTVRTPV